MTQAIRDKEQLEFVGIEQHVVARLRDLDNGDEWLADRSILEIRIARLISGRLPRNATLTALAHILARESELLYELPWQLIATFKPELGSAEVFVWNGKVMLFANWRYGWSLDDDYDGNQPYWCDGRQILSPQPTHWLPLSPPNVRSTGQKP